MMMTDSFLSDASWVFFAAWSVVVAVVSIAAFGRDVLPSKASVDAVHQSRPPDPIQPGKSAIR
jgi:hypothetical protein